ncbi:MAG: hypothetical protein LV473_00930 [Nitrospira sp.]|nr:hypothetical protein [Nitrospira sp.]
MPLVPAVRLRQPEWKFEEDVRKALVVAIKPARIYETDAPTPGLGYQQ